MPDVFLCPRGRGEQRAFLCHPDDLSNARGGHGFWPPDSFAQAKPVPVSELLHPIRVMGLRDHISKRTISRLGRNCATIFPMANRREILPELLKLPVRERARLATELVQSLDESEDPDAAMAWLEELDRRAREVVNGTAKLEDWAKVRRRIELRLRAR